MIQGERNWILESQKEPSYGEYYFSDAPMSCDESFPDIARVEVASRSRKPRTYKGRLHELE